MAGLPDKSATVWVGPPLSCDDPSFGSMGAEAVPIWLLLVPFVMPVRPVPSPIRL